MDSKDQQQQQQHFALRVALQTMKERCVSLQRRLTSVEEENQKLRESHAPTTQDLLGGVGGSAAENFQLRLQLTDVERQKAQLTEHINMVSNENLKLWSRLSQMAKEQQHQQQQQQLGKWPGNAKDDERDEYMNSPRSGGVNQNLIRSKTFTQHSPNPHLRHKVVADEVSNDISLEEVALEVNALNDGNVLNHDVEYAESAEAQLGFAYINVSDEHGNSNSNSNENELSQETKKYIEGLQEIRREALHQQQELNTALRVLEKRLTSPPVCPECAQYKLKKPEMADKSLETDDSLSEIKFTGKIKSSQTPITSTTTTSSSTNAFTQLNGHTAAATITSESVVPATKHINIIQEKINADAMDKTCPMCGRMYGINVTFDAFREHVEMHFVDDTLSDVDASIERNFEMISHAVGDF